LYSASELDKNEKQVLFVVRIVSRKMKLQGRYHVSKVVEGKRTLDLNGKP
jgi:hypothetical protein